MNNGTKQIHSLCKKISFLILGIIIFFVIYVLSITLYKYHHPFFFMNKVVQVSQDYHMEYFLLRSENVSLLGYSEIYKEQQREWHEKVQKYQTEILSSPYKSVYILASSCIEDGNTIVLFSGTAIDADGYEKEIHTRIELSFVLDCRDNK